MSICNWLVLERLGFWINNTQNPPGTLTTLYVELSKLGLLNPPKMNLRFGTTSTLGQIVHCFLILTNMYNGHTFCTFELTKKSSQETYMLIKH